MLALAVLIASLTDSQFDDGRGRAALGKPAPDFEIAALDGKSKFKLSDNFGKKPTVLIFGSYT